MRVWPSGFAGLRLTLSPGWYPLATHITGVERRRLLELIAAGVDDLAYVAEIEWDDLDKLGSRLQLHRTLALVRVPAGAAPSNEIMRVLAAKLGSIRVGLVQRETPSEWPELAWQERQIKVPLLNWLREQLFDAGHPLAQLDVRTLPVDELARHTPEPVELLVMLEDVVAHRMRHVETGVAKSDWERSIEQAVVERFASRFAVIDEAQAAEALELVIVEGVDSAVPIADRLAGARALARAGLASIRGSDMLIGPLARFCGRRKLLPRLLPLLRASAWSEVSRRELGRAMPPMFMLPRAVLMVPEPPYARWPAFSPPVPEPIASLQEVFGQLINHGRLSPQMSLTFSKEERTVDSIMTLLTEVHDPDRLALDVARGRLHRFDAIDRDWSETEGREVRAYLRWLVLTVLLGHVQDAAAFQLIAAEITQVLEWRPSAELRGSLLALLGDVHACMAGYSAALADWEQAETVWRELADDMHQSVPSTYRVSMRRMLGHLRLDQDHAAVVLAESTWGGRVPVYPGVDSLVADMLRELFKLLDTWAVRLGTRIRSSSAKLVRTPRSPGPPAAAMIITRAAVALELGNWPRALEIIRSIDAPLDPPEGARLLLLDATIRGALGDVDAAAGMITTIREHALEHGDKLLLALSHRALASFPSDPSRQAEYRDAIEAASELERESGLPDALLLDLERTGWMLASGNATGEQYEDAVARVSKAAAGAPSLAAASIQAQLRVIALVIASARAKGETPEATLIDGLVALVSGGVKARDVSPWFDHACEQLLAIIQARIDAGAHADALSLTASTRRLIADDARYLAQLDHLEGLASQSGSEPSADE